jgi:hypothetical protein
MSNRAKPSVRSSARCCDHAIPLTTRIRQLIVKLVEIVAAPQNTAKEKASRPWANSHESSWHGWAVLPCLMLAVAAMSCLGSCKQPLVVGEYKCPVATLEGGNPPSLTDPIMVPWATGFENQMDCDYKEVAGDCYAHPPASFQVLASPVHSGQFAAEFTVLTGTDAGSSPQGRCVRQGVLPAEAYYGAWYYIPRVATNTGNWNLFHFQGGNADTTSQHYLWDVSLANGPTGDLNLRLYDNLHKKTVGDGPPIPIARWFHIVFYLRRAKDAGGEVVLFQDEVRVVDLANVVTDDTDWGQWYVGNLASSLQPPQSTVYVDDVTISATL